jgi:hypothetical protein
MLRFTAIAKRFATFAHKAVPEPKNLVCGGCTKMSFPLRFICGDCCYFQDPALHLKKISYFQLFEMYSTYFSCCNLTAM